MEIQVEREVGAAPERVWDVITDLPGSAGVISAIEAIEILGWRETRTMFGKSATEEMVVTAIEPGRSYTVEADSKSAHYTSVLAIGALDSGNSRLSMSFGGEPKGLCAKLLAATVGRMFSGATKRALLQDLDDIATAAERG
jgi:carbon monoxide dehydrogenase subunit G